MEGKICDQRNLTLPTLNHLYYLFNFQIKSGSNREFYLERHILDNSSVYCCKCSGQKLHPRKSKTSPLFLCTNQSGKFDFLKNHLQCPPDVFSGHRRFFLLFSGNGQPGPGSFIFYHQPYFGWNWLFFHFDYDIKYSGSNRTIEYFNDDPELTSTCTNTINGNKNFTECFRWPRSHTELR